MCLSWFILCLQQQNDGGWPTVITHNTTQSSPTMNATDSSSQLYFTLSFSKLLGFKKYVLKNMKLSFFFYFKKSF
jgi:hypothetical protein